MILEKNTTTGNLEVYQLAHTEGRYTLTTGYEYNYTDHLGNTRLVFNIQSGVATKIQSNAYDPWGLELKGIQVDPVKPNNFKYNGKETQAETAWMDYGARM